MPSSFRHILLLAANLITRSASHQLSPYRIAVAPSDLARGPPLSPAITAKAGACLREHGFVILSAGAACDESSNDGADEAEEGVVGRDGECAQCAYEAFTHLKGLIATATSLNGQQNLSPEVVDAVANMQFTEVQRRGAGRYEMRLEGSRHQRFHALANAATAWAAPVVHASRQLPMAAATSVAAEEEEEEGIETLAEGGSSVEPPHLQRLFTGCVTSLPGAAAQGWHADGSLDGLYNVFVPLVDLPADNQNLGPTQFAPGTHLNREGKARLQAPVPGARARWEIIGGDGDDVSDSSTASSSSSSSSGSGSSGDGHSPGATANANWLVSSAPLKAGDLVVFDYRILHRGLANKTPNQVRSIFYVALNAEPGSSGDTVNTPLISLSAVASAASQNQ